MNAHDNFVRSQSKYDNSLPRDECEPSLQVALDEMVSYVDCIDEWLNGHVLPASVEDLLVHIFTRPAPRTDVERDELVTLIDIAREVFDSWAQTRTPGDSVSPIDRWCKNLDAY